MLIGDFQRDQILGFLDGGHMKEGQTLVVPKGMTFYEGMPLFEVADDREFNRVILTKEVIEAMRKQSHGCGTGIVSTTMKL